MSEFKKFAVKGNVIDMAVGVVIGTAFGKLVSSLIHDLVMPVLGILTGKVHFANLFVKPRRTRIRVTGGSEACRSVYSQLR